MDTQSALEISKKLLSKKTDWPDILATEIEKEYFKSLTKVIKNDRQTSVVHPDTDNMFRCFECLPFHKIKVVILGQDPYHGQDQANGLAFSVNRNVNVPPSLYNIYTELITDLVYVDRPKHGDLVSWCIQGVLLLNTVMTVKKDLPGSHKNIGWETFTAYIISQISEKLNGVVFMLWGKEAQKMKKIIDENKHLILEAPHPSPLSVYSGFYGCKHFSKCNDYLKSKGKLQIDWRINN